MRVKFWGVRGSIPCPGPATVKYGGNTPCIELRFDEVDRLIIIDAGSGIREFGNFMMKNDLPKGPIKTEIFLTHTHWDHIMGFPFFVPTYIPGSDIKIYGPETHEKDTLEEIVGGQLSYRYFPVRNVELAASIRYENLKEETRDLGDGITLTAKYLNHPILCLGYRFEFRGKIFCTVYDTEPFANLFCTDTESADYDETMAEEGAMVAQEQNRMLETFYKDADLVVHDTQYTQAEYEAGKIGWGHTSFEYAIKAVNRARVKTMAMFHYEPMRTDAELDELAGQYGEQGKNGRTRLIFSREGMEIKL